MKVFSFQLPGIPGHQFISLRELNGHDEFLVKDTGSLSVLGLLNNIIVQDLFVTNRPGQTVKVEKLTISDRDYLLAGIYKYTYGSRIESSMRCSSCHENYDLDFNLDELVTHSRKANQTRPMDPEGFFYTEDGLRFRLPDGEDEFAVSGLDAEQAESVMFNRCVAGASTRTSKEIMEIMEEIGPVLTTDLAIECPECKTNQSVQFDIQSYLLTKLINERKKLVIEVHNIALAYGWSHKEILDLPRSLRQTYSSLINQN